MKHIDKSLNASEGNQVTDNYLNAICTSNSGCKTYDVKYNTFRWHKGIRFVKQMADVLVKNQQGYCCYCMRRLFGNGDVTVEHILPQSEVDSGYYQRISELQPSKIQLTSVFNSTTNPQYPPYPHIVAYNNLVASCNGMFPKLNNEEVEVSDKPHCCNKKRKEDKAFPIYYLANVDSLVRYSKEDGRIYEVQGTAYQQETRDLILSAKLNWETLKDIRFIWAKMRNTDINAIKSCTDESSRKMFIYRLLKGDEFNGVRVELSKKFEKEPYWKALMCYDWFHTYNWQ